MIKAYKAEAIILSRRNIGEADKLVTVFTKQFGKKTIIAKGVRKITSKRAPYIELFTHVEIILHPGKTFDILTEVTPLHVYPLIRTRLERVSFVCIALELIDRLTADNQESRFIFAKLIEFLSILDDSNSSRLNARSCLHSFKQNILAELGFIRQGQIFSEQALDQMVESVAEREIKSQLLLTNITKHL